MKHLTNKFTVAEYVYESPEERLNHSIEMQSRGWTDSGQVKCSIKEVKPQVLVSMTKRGILKPDQLDSVIFSGVYLDYGKYYRKEIK